jgi:hypothetical protein
MNITIIPNTFSDRYSDLEDFGKKINELSQPLADEESQETVLISGDDEKVGKGTSAEGTVFKVQHRLLFQNWFVRLPPFLLTHHEEKKNLQLHVHLNLVRTSANILEADPRE